MKTSSLVRGLLCFMLITDTAVYARAQTHVPKLQPRILALRLPTSATLPIALLSIGHRPNCSYIMWAMARNRAQEGIRNRKDPDVLLLQVWLGIPSAIR
jgi:hypothetical protein